MAVARKFSDLLDVAAGQAINLPASSTIGGSTVVGIVDNAIESTASQAFAVGANGLTNPAFNVNASTGSQASGLNVTGGTASGTVAVSVLSSGSNASLTVNAKGTGTIGIGSVSTGAVTITPATTITGNATVAAAFITSGIQTVAGGGTTTALSLTKTLHSIDSDAGGDIFTLADGTIGQIVTICQKSSTGVSTVTPANLSGGTSVTMDAAGDSVVLQFVDTDWYIIGGNGYTVI